MDRSSIRMRTQVATDQLITALDKELKGLAMVVSDPEAATGYLLSGIPVVVIAPPAITDDTGPTQTYEWEIPIIGAPINDRARAWASIDRVMESLDSILQVERAHPVTWTGAQTSSAPAYLLTHTQTIYKEN